MEENILELTPTPQLATDESADLSAVPLGTLVSGIFDGKIAIGQTAEGGVEVLAAVTSEGGRWLARRLLQHSADLDQQDLTRLASSVDGVGPDAEGHR